MDRGTWQATVHGVARVRHDLVTTPPPPPPPPPISNEKSENDLKDLESPKCRKTRGKVLKELIKKFTVKAINGSRNVLSCPCQLEKSKLKPGIRAALDMSTHLPRSTVL